MIRPAIVDDYKFVINSWVRSYSSSRMALEATPHDGDHHTVRCEACGGHRLRKHDINGSTRYRAGACYWRGQTELARRLVRSCSVLVDQAEDGLIDGWICREPSAPIVHYIYVRRAARGQGVARALVGELAAASAQYTHLRSGLVGNRLPKNWVYNPYLLMVQP